MMRRAKRGRAPAWTSQEIAILFDVFENEGLDAATDALPERSPSAITTMANKLGIRSGMLPAAPKPKLGGQQLEIAIALREQDGWSFERIGKHLGFCEASVNNAVHIALCTRRGFIPAERDEHGRLTRNGVDRLRAMLRKGMKGVDIQVQLGISAGRVALERRRYSADLKKRGKAALPPPGGGQRYSGAKIPRDVYRQVDELLMAGHGGPRIADITGVSKTHVQRRRMKLVKRLARKRECLPGCDRRGKRHAYKDSLAAVSEPQRQILRAELMKGTPVARAAKIAVIGTKWAYDFRNELKAELERQGKSLPPIVRLGRVKAAAIDRALDWLPKGKRNLIVYRRHLIAADGDQVEAKRRTIAELMPTPEAKAPKRPPLTFEEKLALVASGRAGLVAKNPLRRPDYAGTIGGIATAML